MSSAVESETYLTSKTTPTKVDFVALYETIGNIVIEKAYSGDPVFERIYEFAWRKTSNLNENKAGPGIGISQASRDSADMTQVNLLDI